MRLGFKTTKVFAAVVAFTSFAISSGVEAEEEFRTTCYEEELPKLPFSTGLNSRVWCYREMENERLVFSPENNGEIRPETAMLVKADGSLEFASRVRGKVTFHRAPKNSFNPLGVPLDPESTPQFRRLLKRSRIKGVEKLVGFFHEHGKVDLNPMKLEAGVAKASVPAAALPWRGYWWPYSAGLLHTGAESPLAKYDSFVNARAPFRRAESQQWEADHQGSGVTWAGHCHAWAAASILEPEPKAPVFDAVTKLEFKVSDQKAYLSIQQSCPKIAFFGTRFDGDPGDVRDDVDPITFHKVLTTFIAGLGKPVLVDTMVDRAIQNSVISGYTMSIVELGPGRFHVSADVTLHLYDHERIEEPGVARTMLTRYAYYVSTDEAGEVVSAKWSSKNPDFLWVPLAPGNCEDQNPFIESRWTNEILKLPKAMNDPGF